jgi:hypothetical protein
MADDRARTGTPSDVSPDWATRATAAVESFVELVRDKSLRPALLAVKLVLVGLVTLALGTTILVLASIGIVRLLTEDAFNGRVWAAYLLVSALFGLAGGTLFKLSKRTMKADTHV